MAKYGICIRLRVRAGRSTYITLSLRGYATAAPGLKVLESREKTKDV